MNELTTLDDELRSTIDEIRMCLGAVDSLSGDARHAKLERAKELLLTAERHRGHFNAELRDADQSSVRTFDSKLSDYVKAIATAKQQLAVKRSFINQAGGIASRSGFAVAVGEDDGRGEARRAARRIGDVQDHGLRSLQKSEQIAQATVETGDQIQTDLRKQTEHMEGINQRLDSIESEVQRGKRELQDFIRRMKTDKIILCFILLVIIAVVAFAGLKIYNSVKRKKHHEDNPVPSLAPPAAVTPSLRPL